nr:MAG TPA: hypothetical protein [Caudoviricetes sp.]
MSGGVAYRFDSGGVGSVSTGTHAHIDKQT